jgi:hypothetical protein
MATSANRTCRHRPPMPSSAGSLGVRKTEDPEQLAADRRCVSAEGGAEPLIELEEIHATSTRRAPRS